MKDADKKMMRPWLRRRYLLVLLLAICGIAIAVGIRLMSGPSPAERIQKSLKEENSRSRKAKRLIQRLQAATPESLRKPELVCATLQGGELALLYVGWLELSPTPDSIRVTCDALMYSRDLPMRERDRKVNDAAAEAGYVHYWAEFIWELDSREWLELRSALRHPACRIRLVRKGDVVSEAVAVTRGPGPIWEE